MSMARRAVVTGGTSGIGLAVARLLCKAGHAVWVTYAHDAARAEAAVAAAQADGLTLTAVACDVSKSEDWEALQAHEPALREAEILVHAAGFARDGLLMTQPLGDFDAVLAVHLRGAAVASRALLRGMIGARFGRVVYLSSPTAGWGRRGQTSYGAAKAGLFGLMRSLVQEVSRFQITVNCVVAGLVETGLTHELPPQVRAELLAGIPMARCGSADEVAALVGFLTQPSAGYITGQCIAADGGLDGLLGDSL